MEEKKQKVGQIRKKFQEQIGADVDRARPHPLQLEGQDHGLAAVARDEDGAHAPAAQGAGDEAQGLLAVAREDLRRRSS